jgi:hypothetical protein
MIRVEDKKENHMVDTDPNESPIAKYVPNDKMSPEISCINP